MAIVAYTKQDDYDVVNDNQDCIGWTVTDQSGKDFGKVTEMLVNTDTEMVDSISFAARVTPATCFAPAAPCIAA